MHVGEGKKRKVRLFVCEEGERGVCSMERTQEGITLMLTPKTGKSLGKAYLYILLHTSAVKHVYISLVFVSLCM